MKLHPRVTPAAVDLVKRFEGFRPRAAKTPEGRFTIGYGHLLSPRDSADEAAISEAEAEFLLKHDLAVVAEAIEDSVLAPVNDNQFAALLSFAFNIGVENFKGSSALRRLNEGAYLQAAAALELWRRADFGGEVLVVDQLVRRRAVEKALFLAPPEGFMPLPSSVLRPAFDHSVIGAAVAWAAARERTAVSRIALEGPETGASLSVPPGREGEPAPSAAIAAADALAVRLSRILPEDETHSEEPTVDSAPPPLVLKAEPDADAEPELAFETESDSPVEAAPPTATIATFAAAPRIDFTGATPEVSADAPLRYFAPAPAPEPAVTTEPKAYDSGFDLPPPPSSKFAAEGPTGPHPLVGVEEGHAEDHAFAAQAHYDAAESAAEPPPLVRDPSVSASPSAASPDAASQDAEAPVAPWRRRFGGRVPTPGDSFATAANAEPEVAPSLFDPPAPLAAALPEPASFDAFGAEPTAEPVSATEAPVAPTTPLFERPVFFQVLGLIGIALFAGSIFCMLHKASFGCLLIGVVGILAMAPAAAFFLFRFLGQPIDPNAAEHADLASMMQAHGTAETVAEEAPTPSAEKKDSPFDTAWR